MAYNLILLLVISVSTHVFAITCPGFPGYCSESFVGQTCVVVCSKGRPNVPLCQDDGTWTDIPRCVEHDPGKEEQIPGLCPGIGGYCSEGFLYQRCNFKCGSGKMIDSQCTQDGTWEPYPTCPGDLRETNDGCNPCPGPLGRVRNRTLEAHSVARASIDRRVKAQQAALDTRFLGINSRNKQTRTSNVIDTSNRVVRPTFAGSLAFGAVSSSTTNTQTNSPNRSKVHSFIPTQTKRPRTQPAPTPPALTTRRPITSFRQPTMRPASRPQQTSLTQPRTPVIEPQRTSPFVSVGADGRIQTRPESVSGPAPNFQQQSSRRNQFSGGRFPQRGQNMVRQQSTARRPQSGFTPEQRKIIQEALAKLPKSVRGGSNFFSQQSMVQQQPTRQNQFTNFPQQQPQRGSQNQFGNFAQQQPQIGSQNQFANFPQQQSQMNANTTPRRLDFNPLRSQGPPMQQLQPQSRPRARPQSPPQRQPSQPQVQRQPNPPQTNRQPQPQVQPQQPPQQAAPSKSLSALQRILAIQAKRGPTDPKFGGTTPAPTERPKPQPVMLFQEDNSNPTNVQPGSDGNSFGVFQVLDLNSPTQPAALSRQLQAFPAIPNTDRSSGRQVDNSRGVNDNSQFGVFETVQLG